MRAACSGGRYPLEDITDGPEDDEEQDGSSENHHKPNKTVKYSKFEFNSKFRTLITELERIRDEDPSCKYLEIMRDIVFEALLTVSYFSDWLYSQEFGVFPVHVNIELASSGIAQTRISVPHALW